MSYHTDDTICAIASAAGGAARGMLRISGRDAVGVAGRVFCTTDRRALDEARMPSALTGQLKIELPGSEVAVGTSPCPALSGTTSVPCELFVWSTNRSYTREPVVELHTLGSPPLLQAALATICRNGARLAEPGEFTLRAFLAGRLDLTQAEAVLGVIDAADSNELDVALEQLAGGLARPLHSVRESLLQLLAELEAGLDFVEDDIEFVSQAEVASRLRAAGAVLNDITEQMQSRHVATDLARVALLGEPNVGKSSLFNALVKEYGANDSRPGSPAAALVSPIRGTTRDYLTATVAFGDVRCELVDTAGFNAEPRDGSVGAIDAAAQAFALERRQEATVRAVCVAALDLVESGWLSVVTKLRRGEYDVVVVTKCDLTNLTRERHPPPDVPIVATSSRTGFGLSDFCTTVRGLLTRDEPGIRNSIIAATADRCRESTHLANGAVDRAASLAAASAGDELVAAEIRNSLAELGKVVGAVYTDDLLDRIFKTFCIGK